MTLNIIYLAIKIVKFSLTEAYNEKSIKLT